ncbi:MAG TPA: hypothetical protein VF571_07205 [Pyrinomonadaceae bacterium]|jgi:hypothetical protein
MIEYTIYCDFCGEMIDIQSGSARQARKKAKAKGLLIRILRKDYCPKCADKLHNEGEIDLNQLDKKIKMLSNSK